MMAIPKKRVFLAVGALGLTVGFILLGFTLYYFAGFNSAALAVEQYSGFGQSAVEAGYIHYYMSIFVSFLLIIMGIILIYRNARIARTKR